VSCQTTALKVKFDTTSMRSRICQLLPFQLMRTVARIRNEIKENIVKRRNQNFERKKRTNPDRKNNGYKSKFNFTSIMVSVLKYNIITIKPLQYL